MIKDRKLQLKFSEFNFMRIFHLFQTFTTSVGCATRIAKVPENIKIVKNSIAINITLTSTIINHHHHHHTCCNTSSDPATHEAKSTALSRIVHIHALNRLVSSNPKSNLMSAMWLCCSRARQEITFLSFFS